MVLLLPQLFEHDRGQVAKRAVEAFVIEFLSPPSMRTWASGSDTKGCPLKYLNRPEIPGGLTSLSVIL